MNFLKSGTIEKGNGAMRNRILYAMAFLLLAVGVASGATIFVDKSSTADDFCFGYAICK